MAKGTNLCIIIGGLGKDPETIVTKSGTTKTTLTIATSDSHKDKQTGDWVDETEWHRVILWDKKAEIAARYLRKGREVYIRGKKKTRSWLGDDGKKNYIVEVIADDMQLLGGKGHDTPADVPIHQPQASLPPNTEAGDPGYEDDIPL